MKVILIPETITSRMDGDQHFISTDQLKHLYGVRAEDEVVRPNPHDPRFRDEETMRRYFPEHTILRPRYDGKYYDIHEDSLKDPQG